MTTLNAMPITVPNRGATSKLLLFSIAFPFSQWTQIGNKSRCCPERLRLPSSMLKQRVQSMFEQRTHNLPGLEIGRLRFSTEQAEEDRAKRTSGHGPHQDSDLDMVLDD